MWPYLNLEDLTKPRPFLLMEKARGRNHPSYFASADREAMHLGHVIQAIVPTFLNCYTVLLNRLTDRNADHEYGKLISWDDHPDSFSWVMSQQQFHPGEALLVLEAQDRLMSFLVDCCKQILHDIPSDQLTSNIYPIRPEPSLKSDVDVAGYASMAAMAAEAPYRLPISLDISRISSLLSAVAVDKEDHLWSLREDPGYFDQSVLDYADHRAEMVLDTLGKKHTIFKPQREELFWHRVIGAVVSKSYLWLEVFSNLAQQSRQLQELQMKHNSSISADQDLPPEYLDALLKFRYYLVQAADDLLDLLQHSVESSAPFRPFFVRAPTTSGSIVNDIRPKGLKMDLVEGNLYWLLKTLSDNDNDLLLIRMTLALDELQRLLDAELKASNMITEHISKVIGDLAVIGECLRQLDSYHPWALTFENLMVDNGKKIESEYANESKLWKSIQCALAEPDRVGMSPLGKPADKKLQYPVWKRRTKENVEILRQSEANLDEFWSHIDRKIQQRFGDLSDTAVRNLLTQPRILQRTPPWAEPDKGGKLSQNANKALEMRLSEVYYELEARTTRTIGDNIALGRGTKVKTRKPASAQTTPIVEPDAVLVDSQPTFAVDARALKVFRTIFFSHSHTATPGEVLWNDFLYAMISTGFGAEKMYGSVWHFTPTKLDVERSIQIHEPRPTGKIAYRIARRHGRRLSRAYGWHGGMFVLRDPKPKGLDRDDPSDT